MCTHMGWLQLVGSIQLEVSFAKEPYKRDDILKKKPIIESILLTVANIIHTHANMWMMYIRGCRRWEARG